jgi:formylglycine-generating enzyme required for sulfatase activity
VAVTWDDAAAQCKAEGKRLCKDTEWTLACEGEDRLPHPYGYVRDATACNFDKTYILPDNDAYANPRTRDAEVARLDQRELSGSRERCVSQYGVYDMTGNVDEWVVNTRGTSNEAPYVSGLKGGYWGPVRNRCRVMTTDHNMWHSGYQIGFRCCGDAS